MKALDQAEQDPQTIALRYMPDGRGERPMLNCIATVRLTMFLIGAADPATAIHSAVHRI